MTVAELIAELRRWPGNAEINIHILKQTIEGKLTSSKSKLTS